MFKGTGEACGVVDASEGDCVRNAVYSYRNWAQQYKGISTPNILCPNTFDPALDRACELLNVELRRMPMNDKHEFSKIYS